MIELIFEKADFCYQSVIDLGGDEAYIELDTGSPITTISIPNLLQITGESLFAFRKKSERFLAKYKGLSLGVYGTQVNEVRHEFIPYLIRNIKIGNVTLPYFMFWVDITNINSSKIVPTSILFGFDYIGQGTKSFDGDDNFHIVFNEIKADTFGVQYVMSNINDQINEIDSLLKSV